jgi:glycosyltransferase involved in cell wall biosynthesis
MLSVLTPTKNRFQEFHLAIECMKRQDFQGQIEWVIVEDGEQDVRTLLEGLPETVKVQYTRLDGSYTIGEKRNVCLDKATHEVCVFWDDDDFYDPEYLSQTYWLLTSQKVFGVVGSPIVVAHSLASGLTYAKGKSGNHSPCGVLAFTKRAVQQYELRFRDRDTHGEERYFLKDFCVPLMHRNPMKSIVAIQHGANTWNVVFDKDEEFDYTFPDWAKKCIETYFHKTI